MTLRRFISASATAFVVAFVQSGPAFAKTVVYGCGPSLPERCLEAPDIEYDDTYVWVEDGRAETRLVADRLRRDEVVVVKSSRPITTRDCRNGSRFRVVCPVQRNTLASFDVSLGAGDDRLRIRGMGAFIADGAGDDVVRGGPWDDLFHGGDGWDIYRGGRGSDAFFTGGGGGDRVYGGDGDDNFYDGAGPDEFYGGPGDDSFDFYRSEGRPTQIVSCGSGLDDVDFRSRWRGARLSERGCEDLKQFDADGTPGNG